MRNGSLGELLGRENIPFDDVVLGRLDKFASLLHEWNGTHNLTGAKTISAIYDNIVDSLYPLTFVDRPKTLLDVGSGAGFPGLALATALSETDVVLCEPLGKRAAFLKYAAMEMDLSNVEVAKTRVEKLEHDSFALITSRAVSDTRLLLDLTDHLSDSKTQYLFYKGSRAQEEMDMLTNLTNYDIVQWKKRNFVWIK
jgi:16S rRNA (guanine527-N7)-methyltransferase